MNMHKMSGMMVVGIAGAMFAACSVQAETLLWYRFDGDGATIENKANPGTMDGVMKSIDTWGSLGGLGDTEAKFPTRCDAFPAGTRLIDPATDAVHQETVKSLSFTGNPANSGTVRLLKADTTAAFKEMMSFTCEVFFKLPTDASAIETRRAKDILFPLVDWGCPDDNGYGWFFGLRKDDSNTGFYPFFRYRYNDGTSPIRKDVQQKLFLNDGNWHHLAVVMTADETAHTATISLVLDYKTIITSGTLSGFYGFHKNNTGNFPLLVGADVWRKSNGTQNCCFMGEIAEVRISNTALAHDQLLRPLPAGPVDSDTLVYLPMGDCDWFGAPSAITNIHYGIMNAAPTAVCTPEWLINASSSIPYPSVVTDAIGSAVRGGYFSTAAYGDEKSMRFSRALDNDKYVGHVVKIPYENAQLAEDSFTMEWFFKADGQVPTSSNGNTSYTFLYNSFAKVLINQENGSLLTRLVKEDGTWDDFSSANRVDDSQWHHYALVYDKAQGAFAVYLDYRLIKCKTLTLRTSTGVPFCFGGQDRNNQAFKGQLDDFRITKRTLKANEFLTTRQVVSEDADFFAHFNGDFSTGQDPDLAPDGVGGTLGGGSEPAFKAVDRRIDLDGDGRADRESVKALGLDGGSVVWPHNPFLECRDFTMEWFAKYDSLQDNSMLLRMGMESATGRGTINWALYTFGNALRLSAHVSPDGLWRDITRYNMDFEDSAVSKIADGRWRHFALVVQTTEGAASTNTSFTLYREYEQVGSTIVFDNDGKGGALAFPSTGTTLSIGTGGGRIKGMIDELRFRQGVQPVSSFMRYIPTASAVVLR